MITQGHLLVRSLDVFLARALANLQAPVLSESAKAVTAETQTAPGILHAHLELRQGLASPHLHGVQSLTKAERTYGEMPRDNKSIATGTRILYDSFAARDF